VPGAAASVSGANGGLILGAVFGVLMLV
jgi:hypothetical protein